MKVVVSFFCILILDDIERTCPEAGAALPTTTRHKKTI